MRINIALPVMNEESALEDSVRKIAGMAASFLPDDDVVIVICDNGSDDRTGEIGKRLAAEIGSVRYLRLAERGKGLAIRRAWKLLEADVYVFMDIDLATDLGALPELVHAAADCGGLAIGSRFHRDSRATRSFGRKVTSLAYRRLLRSAFGTKVNDAPCGFKAATDEVVSNVVPFVRDDHWFFDTELIIRAERAGYSIREIPIVWRERPLPGRRSKVNVPKLTFEYLCKIIDLKRRLR